MSAAPSKRPLTAAQRTVPMPGVDLREQDNRSHPVMLQGPHVERVAFVMPDEAPTWEETHYVLRGSSSPLCGARVRRRSVKGKVGRVCAECHVVASKQRAVLV